MSIKKFYMGDHCEILHELKEENQVLIRIEDGPLSGIKLVVCASELTEVAIDSDGYKMMAMEEYEKAKEEAARIVSQAKRDARAIVKIADEEKTSVLKKFESYKHILESASDFASVYDALLSFPEKGDARGFILFKTYNGFKLKSVRHLYGVFLRADIRIKDRDDKPSSSISISFDGDYGCREEGTFCKFFGTEEEAITWAINESKVGDNMKLFNDLFVSKEVTFPEFREFERKRLDKLKKAIEEDIERAQKEMVDKSVEVGRINQIIQTLSEENI